MARNTVGGGVSDMAADREEARRNLLSQGNADPSPEDLDAELQKITDKRAASAHLEQGDGGTVTPESQAAKAAGGDPGAEPDAEPDAAGEQGGDPDAFDPADWTVAEVQEYLDGLADDDAGRAEYDRVIAAERSGKGRTTITG